MGCGSSSLKGTEDVGTNAGPSVPNNNPLQPTSAPMSKVKTNFSTVDYDAATNTNKGSQLKDQAPDELDEGPSRNASYVSPTTTHTAPNLAGETNDGIMEKPAAVAENKLEPYHTISDDTAAPMQPQVGEKTSNLVQ